MPAPVRFPDPHNHSWVLGRGKKKKKNQFLSELSLWCLLVFVTMCIVCTGLEQTDSKMYSAISFLSKEHNESVASEQQGSLSGDTHSAPAGVGLCYSQNNWLQDFQNDHYIEKSVPQCTNKSKVLLLSPWKINLVHFKSKKLLLSRLFPNSWCWNCYQGIID